MSGKLLNDLFIHNRQFGSVSSNRDNVDINILRGDLKQVDGRSNLTQSILNRLFTRKGEIAGLGHPEYGSRLYQLMGEPNNKRTRALAELYIRESLDEEIRIKEIVSVIVEEPPRNSIERNMIIIKMALLAVEEEEPLTISLSMKLED